MAIPYFYTREVVYLIRMGRFSKPKVRLLGHAALQGIADAAVKHWEDGGLCFFCSCDQTEGFMRSGPEVPHEAKCPVGQYLKEIAAANPV